MRRLALTLFVVSAMTGIVRADCGPYVALFEKDSDAFETVFLSDFSTKDRAQFANYIGYFLITVYQEAEERQLHEMQECTRAIYSGFHDKLKGPVQIALSAGWAGWFSPDQRDNVLIPSRENTRQRAAEVVAEAEKIATITGLLPPLADEETATANTGIIGEWHGVELILVISGKSQRIDLSGVLAIEKAGTYKADVTSVFVDAGRWRFDGSVLTLESDQPADKKSISWTVTFHDGQMLWEATRHGGQWSEKWTWQR